MGFKTNLYKIPHLSTMTYEDIKNFEENGITPRNSARVQKETNEQQVEPSGSEEEDLLG